jgi:hypothetical protein
VAHTIASPLAFESVLLILDIWGCWGMLRGLPGHRPILAINGCFDFVLIPTKRNKQFGLASNIFSSTILVVIYCMETPHREKT